MSDGRLDVVEVGATRNRIYAGWSIVGLGFLLQFIASGPVYYAFGSYAPSIAETFDVPRTLLNLCYSLVMFIGAVGSAPVGWLIDRVNIRGLAVMGLIGTALGLCLASIATEYWQMLLLFGTLIGMGEAFIGNLTVNYLICHWFERRRGLAIGLAVVGASAAAIVFPPLASALVERSGWRSTLMLFGIAMAFLAIPTYFLVRLPGEIPDFERKPRISGAEVQSVRGLGFKELIRSFPFWIIVLCCGGMIGVNGAVMITMVPYAISLGFSGLQGAALLSIVGGGAMVGKLSFGLIADRVDLRWAQRMGLILMIAGLIVLMIGTNYTGIVVAAIIYGLALGGMLPVWAALVAHIYGLSRYGSILGYSRAAMTPLTISCPLIAGATFDLTGGYQAAWFSFAIMLSLILLLTFVIDNWANPIAAE